ncbi:hypothetical protein [Streptomyces sp. MJM8645]|uniref:hypothetical protein n=1 Tax=Streptomycetaceae TaxID=2062 RepID=UPI0007AEFF38|nr:hypothetical protein [Streptomyces sp. MJM8645]
MTYDDPEDRAEAQTRQRQAAALEHIRAYYRLERRLGVTVALGGRVRHDGREGVITDTAGQRLKVMFYGDEQPSLCHVTSQMEYETATGWVAATPVPDPWAAGPVAA